MPVIGMMPTFIPALTRTWNNSMAKIPAASTAP
ncbi:unannotated protein [freshwater metagenome]|uniref:Unannotated protein n=1 Tax=freshwater metagenome TaxID=449393 RepID=A0A6J7GKD3_9ZZZZ